MKAAILKGFGKQLVIETLPDPVIGTAQVVVDVLAAGFASDTADIFSGAQVSAEAVGSA